MPDNGSQRLEQLFDGVRADRRTALLPFLTAGLPDRATSIALFETIMVESTGDSLLRQEAIRSFRDAVPTARAIEHLSNMRDREADPNMQIFLEAFLADLRGER